MKQDFLNLWPEEIHGQSDQKKRISSAQKAACTPVQVEQDNLCGSFEGGHGAYSTTLSLCTCVDFNRRKLPCKHIYRLAMELGLIDCEFTSDKNKIKHYVRKADSVSISDTVKFIENLSDELQQYIYNVLYEMIYRKNNPYCMYVDNNYTALLDSGIFIKVENKSALINSLKKNEVTRVLKQYNIEYDKSSSKKLLFDWCIACDSVNVSMFPEYSTIAVNPIYERSMHKLYKYLSRKWGDDTVYSAEIDSFVTVRKLDTILPDDEITSLLKQYGYY